MAVVAVHRSDVHSFSKVQVDEISLIAGLGVDGDAHCGAQVKHRSRVRRDPTQPNLRQVHLLHAELFDALSGDGFTVRPGDLGENITTSGLDLLGLPTGAVVRIGPDALVGITGLRNPCKQIDDFQTDLLTQVLQRDGDVVVRKSGVMGVVLRGGVIRAGDEMMWSAPPGPHIRLERV